MDIAISVVVGPATSLVLLLIAGAFGLGIGVVEFPAFVVIAVVAALGYHRRRQRVTPTAI